jgi:hypothetical protein
MVLIHGGMSNTTATYYSGMKLFRMGRRLFSVQLNGLGSSSSSSSETTEVVVVVQTTTTTTTIESSIVMNDAQSQHYILMMTWRRSNNNNNNNNNNTNHHYHHHTIGMTYCTIIMQPHQVRPMVHLWRIQRAMRRFRSRRLVAVAMAFHSRLGVLSPLAVLPIDLFVTKVLVVVVQYGYQ